ncbi:regucalcin-like isoform X1 [Leguminivora glycinivorella]|uniref:regucalcin-like isoform X1 n=1 Tax=Leguminivora glycinivorella TaxID=1035111 RepID=UPI00200E5DBF|nr:regucalcin-like isoform X1 [Leguminivora glycinivorella]
MSPKVEKISEQALLIGEGPHWDDRTQSLYFVSILENTIHKYDAATGTHTSTKLDGRPGFIVPLDGHLDQFVVGLEREFVVVQWDGVDAARVVRLLGDVDQHAVGNRINDGKADPRGRLYAGTMDAATTMETLEAHKGTLYRLDESGITALCDRITISNGLAWDVGARAMYYIDSAERNIRRYDYDADTGDVSNPQFIFDLKQHDVEGLPDGCTIDTDGNLWVALFGGGCVIQVSPDGQLLRAVPVPAKQVTSCTFGGPELDILFVTTARIDTVEEQKFPSGCTFKITGLGVKGHPNVNFKL